jgi:hypothetical protein
LTGEHRVARTTDVLGGRNDADAVCFIDRCLKDNDEGFANDNIGRLP